MKTLATRILHTLAALLLLALAAPRAGAQETGGAVEGVARSAQDGAPLPFLLVRLLPAAEGGAARQVLTDGAGRYRVAGVPAGEYRLQVEQIGYERTLSPAVKIENGATLQQEIRSAMVPIQLAGLTVRAGGMCLGAAQLAEDPELAALWNEAKKGADTRRAFDLQYRFTRVLRQDGQARWRFKGPSAIHRADTTTSEPDSVLVRQRRRAEDVRENGYGSRRAGFSLRLPDDKELFDDEFLRAHCLEAGVDRGDGTLGVRFRPLQTPRDRIVIRGTLWVDAATYQMRRLEVEHVQGTRSIARTSVDYDDTAVGGSRLRLPARGQISGHPGGLVGSALLTGLTADLTYTYTGFQRVQGR